ncbi:type II toxin-antitoxin system RelE/ParE family toxin [uncultured Rhodoblastus sp.]|uniref:type II toxin-antitoxin system RelE/ParE family toxin n=1 Tax=uncultured Rhodoblastus sp. TaxID=543037 RepID=UPI002600A3F3|nr:type II toxin-antitoxin system RelE/ParE family toxin [uncultured Rhodoblastus sp.]
MNRLVITPRAAADIEDIADLIALDNLRAALRLVERFEEVARLLRDNPQIGVAHDEIAAGVRIFPIGNYLMLFRALEDGAEIVRVIHGARRLEGLV